MGWIPLREVGQLLRITGRYWYDDRAPRGGVALGYYMALSLAPGMVMMLAIAGFAFGAKTAQGGLIGEMQKMVGPAGAGLIQTMVEGTHRTGHGFAPTVLGLFTLSFGATAVVNELLTLKLCVLAAERYLNPAANPHRLLSLAMEWLASPVVTAVLFALLFKLMPDVSLKWSDVTIGSIFTSVLFAGGKFLLSIYLSGAGFTDAYGAAGVLVILLVWVYYSAQVLFPGAEFTRAYTGRFGSRATALATSA
jgi:membrane protein